MTSFIREHAKDDSKTPSKFVYNLPCTCEDIIKKQWDDTYDRYHNPVYQVTETYRPQRDKEARVNQGDLVCVEAKKSDRAGFWKCDVMSGPHRRKRGLVPFKLLSPEPVSREMRLMHVLRIDA
eukprot:CAMPEP_0167832528 /NCGR_PEP_ID=MMETSP0112_2-20121227/14409_1 /TAXON_ID=91324 /ORGANISM="Lotharella globosa, Strain CCCM811" /LENGTH=122 /DNA_ID=CAMNT_0007737631 /DNA_START=32 /DNA_END=396 /DNA_ORIENTATION=+